MSQDRQELTISAADGTTAVSVITTPEVAEALAASSRPWLDVSSGASAEITVIGGSDLAATAERERITAALADEPDRVLSICRDRREVVVHAEDATWLHQQLLRTVRNLLRWQQVGKSRTVFLHAGTAVYGDVGVAFIGRKRSGKTSSVLAALAGGADFLSNDDVSLRHQNGTWFAYGWPRTLVVRAQTRTALSDRLPRLTGPRDAFGHPTNAADARSDADLWVNPHELAAAIPGELVRQAAVGALVLPVFDSSAAEPSLRRLEPGEAAERLRPNHERLPVKYDAFLADWFAAELDEAETSEEAAARLAGSLPVFELRQRMETLHLAQRLVADVAAEVR